MRLVSSSTVSIARPPTNHYRRYALFAQGKARVHAAVVKLDALAYPVRAAAEYHDLFSIRGVCFARWRWPRVAGYVEERPFIGRVQVRGVRLELSGTGVNRLEDRHYPCVFQGSFNLVLCLA